MAPTKRRAPHSKMIGALEDDEQEKLRLYLADFDKQVEKRLQQMEREGEILIKAVETAHRLELLKFPKSLRDMKWRDFLAADGDVEKKLEDDIEFAIPALPPKKKKGTATVATAKKQRSNSRTAGSKGGRNSRANKSSVSAMQTPCAVANKANKTASFAITPKIDIRKHQFTPATAFRAPRMGEVTWSTKGSPVIINTKKDGETLNSASDSAAATFVKNGKVLHVTDSPENEEGSVPQLDDAEVKQLKQLQNKLSRILSLNLKESDP